MDLQWRNRVFIFIGNREGSTFSEPRLWIMMKRSLEGGVRPGGNWNQARVWIITG